MTNKTDFYSTGYTEYGNYAGEVDVEQAWDNLVDDRLPDLTDAEVEIAHDSFVEGWNEAIRLEEEFSEGSTAFDWMDEEEGQ